MKTYVVSGAASGIGAATTALLREQGHRVITVDQRDADQAIDVVADLGTPEGRAAAVAGVRELTDVLHGLVPAAGLAGRTGMPSEPVISVNFFGAIALVTGLHPELTRGAQDGGAGVVLLASNSITGMPGWNAPVAQACLRDDEELARAEGAKVDSVMVYPSTKAALAWWARREGVKPEWAGAGIRINSVAPGATETAMVEQMRADPLLGSAIDAYPTAIGRTGRPEEVAATIAFLLSEGAGNIVGAVLFVDGGTDAMLHPMAPQGWEVTGIDI